MAPPSYSTFSNRLAPVWAGAAILATGGFLWSQFELWSDRPHYRILLEGATTMLALFIGLISLVQFFSRHLGPFLHIGLGFLAAAILNGFYAVLNVPFVDVAAESPRQIMLPWSWLATQLYLSILLRCSWLVGSRESAPVQVPRALRIIGLVVGLAVATIFALKYVPLPKAFHPGLFMHRPQELVPAFFFLLAFSDYWRKGGWRTDSFERSLLIALGLLFFCHAFVMAFSARVYDGYAYTAQMIRITSFGVVLYGLTAEMLRLFRHPESRNVELEQLAGELQQEIEERRKREMEINRLNQSLEKTIDERTRFARRSEMAALNMMQDAQDARAAAEAALKAVRESEEKVQAIVESAMDAVITIDAQSRITGWNRCAANMFGWEADEVMNRSLTDTIIPSHLHERHLRGLQRFLTANKSCVLHRRIEMTAQRRDGTQFPVELSIASFQLKGAHTFSAFVRDITQTKEYEARQKQLIDDLQSALAQVKTLTGLLPICAHCKKIRDDTGYWTQLEIYMAQHADVSFTHGICPECMNDIRESMASDNAPRNSSPGR